jgi:hypothetical protein
MPHCLFKLAAGLKSASGAGGVLLLPQALSKATIAVVTIIFDNPKEVGLL